MVFQYSVYAVYVHHRRTYIYTSNKACLCFKEPYDSIPYAGDVVKGVLEYYRGGHLSSLTAICF